MKLIMLMKSAFHVNKDKRPSSLSYEEFGFLHLQKTVLSALFPTCQHSLLRFEINPIRSNYSHQVLSDRR